MISPNTPVAWAERVVSKRYMEETVVNGLVRQRKAFWSLRHEGFAARQVTRWKVHAVTGEDDYSARSNVAVCTENGRSAAPFVSGARRSPRGQGSPRTSTAMLFRRAEV